MKLTKQNFILILLLLIASMDTWGQNTCPTVFYRNNGNGQSGDCPGVPGSSVGEATSVTGTIYSWSNLGLNVADKQGEIGFQFPIALTPSFEPAIKNIWIGTTAVNDRKAGPPAPYNVFNSNKRFTYCFYNNNLPNAGSFTVELVNPQTNSTFAICSYDGVNSLSAPTIYNNPSSQSVCVGNNATFNVVAAASSGTLSYQWRKNGTNIIGASNSSYTINATNINDAGNYDVVITQSGNASMISSSIATLTITNPPTITMGQSTSACAGSNGIYSYTATTNNPIAYSIDWNSTANNAGIPDVANVSLPLNNISVAIGSNVAPGTYAGVLTLQSSSCNSSNYPISITVNKAPTFVNHPINATTCNGSTSSFSVSAQGTPTPTFQWQQNNGSGWTNISNATNNTYNVVASLINSGTQFRAVATNQCGSVNSNVATLTTTTAPVFTTHPLSSTHCNGGVALLTAEAIGSQVNSIQWQVNDGNGWTNISNATNSSYSLVTSNANSGYQYRVIFTNTCGSTTSNNATISLNAGTQPTVSISSSSNIACAGTLVSFNSVSFLPGNNPIYQWNINGNAVAGATNADFQSSNLNNNDVVSLNMVSSETCANPALVSSTNNITMTINPVASQPSNFILSSDTLYWGQDLTSFSVANNPNVTFNWSFSGNGLNILGSGNSIQIETTHGASNGVLSVTASNGCGSSAPRTKAIYVKPFITWKCNGNNNWNDSNNWDAGFVPTITNNVLIPNNVTCFPSIPSSKCVRDLVIEANATISIPTNATLCVNGNLDNKGTICEGTLLMNGTTAQNISGNGIVCNFELNNPNNATITLGDTLKIKQSFRPTNGVLTTNGGLELMSDSNQTATILEHTNSGTCSNYINGNIIVHKYIAGGRRAFRFLAHPFSTSIGLNQLTDDIDITGNGGATNGFSTTANNNPSAFWYNTISGNGSSVDDSTGWIPFTNTNGVNENAWLPYQGVRMYIRGEKGQGLGCTPCVPNPVTIDMMGPVNQCDVVVNLESNLNEGYNLVGNPYPSNIDMSLLAIGNSVGNNFSVWDPRQGIYGAYVTQPFAYSYILPAYSSFITTNSSNTNNTITFNENAKVNSQSTDNLFKTTNTNSFGSDVVALTISSVNDSINWDRLLVFFKNNSSKSFDQLDASKLNNVSLDFYSKTDDDKNLSVDFRPLSIGDKIPLGLRVDSLQTYSINVKELNVPTGIQLYLKDKYLNKSVAINSGTQYIFDVNNNALSQGENRFEIIAGSATDIHETTDNEIQIKISPNPASDYINVHINKIGKKSQIQILNTIGQIVLTKDIENQTLKLPISNLTPGIYTVVVKNENQNYVQKLVIKN